MSGYEYDASVSAVENYMRQVNALKRAAGTLAEFVAPSDINDNKRMASDQSIEQIRLYVMHLVEVVKDLEGKLCFRG